MATNPVAPIYRLPGLNEPLLVYDGPARTAEGDGFGIRIWAPLIHNAELQWEADATVRFDLGTEEVILQADPVIGFPVRLWVSNTDGHGTVSSSVLATGDSLARVVANWINLPPMYTLDLLETEQRQWRGRLVVEAAGWRFTLDSRSDFPDLHRRMRHGVDEFLITHVSELVRCDRKDFDSADASQVLEALQNALSFVVGRWVGPSLPVGFNRKGVRCWELWAPWRCDRAHGTQSWLPTFRAHDVGEFVRLYVEAYLDSAQHPVVRHLARHVIAANTASVTLEARIMIAQAGLEYLSWVDLVLSEQLSRKRFKQTPTADCVRQLLRAASIPTAVPDDLAALKGAVGPEEDDGPGRLAWVRNRIVHPKAADEPYRSQDLIWEASQLTIEYAELLLLKRVGYTGHYMRRYPPGRHAGTSEPVPWVFDHDHPDA